MLRVCGKFRRALEEAYIAERDGGSSDDATELLRQVRHVMREKPSELDVNLFDFRDGQSPFACAMIFGEP